VSRNGSSFLNRLNVLTGRYVEELNWTIIYEAKWELSMTIESSILCFHFLTWALHFGSRSLGTCYLQHRLLPKHFSGRFPNFGPVAWPEFAHWCCGGHRINQHALWRYGVKYDNCYVTEHRWMNSKYITYIASNPFPLSKFKEYASCQYFKFVTSAHLFMGDYFDDERNTFVRTWTR